MRRTAKNSHFAVASLALFVVLAWFALAAPRTAAASGITVTPAALSISLPKGQAQQQATLSFTNHYDAAVALHLAVAQSIQTPGAAARAIAQVQPIPADLSLAAGQTATAAIVLTDSQKLDPGSQQLELVVTQLGTGSGNVGVVPSVRLPLAIIKQDGAVTALTAMAPEAPRLALGPPALSTATLTNSGNVLVIPRGYVTVTDPRGRAILKGVLNTGSQAVAPGAQLVLHTKLTALSRSWMPGVYHVQIAYGTGSGAPASIATTQFICVPPWLLALLALLAAIAFCGRQIWVEWQRLRSTRLTTHQGAA